MDISSAVRLNNGVEIPLLGLGVFLAGKGKDACQVVRWALEIGYRHIDTAAMYENEEDVGRALRESGVPREQVFITTKVWNNDQGYESTLKAFDESRGRLDLDVVDLYLVHWPVKGKSRDTWRALEKLYADGKVRAIGVSNFAIHHLEDLLRGAEVTPAVNQVEFHPFLVQKQLLEFDRAKHIQHEAWSPLTRAKKLEQETIRAIARKHGRTNAQVLLRWDLQLGVVTIPKSVHRERILENSRIWDFELSAEDMKKLEGLDTGTRIGPDPDNFSF